MQQTIKSAIAAAALGCTTLASGLAQADVSANITAASNYIWRGVSQTADQAAVQGGVDYSHDSGLYAGTWVSNVNFGDFGYELDLYGGYAGEFGDFGYDVGLIYYVYPTLTPTQAENFAEVFGTVGWKWVSTGIYYTVDKQETEDGDVYIPLSFDFEFDQIEQIGSVGLSLYGGRYSYADAGLDNYFHWGIGVSKDAEQWGSFGINYDQTDPDSTDVTDPTVTVSWTKEF